MPLQITKSPAASGAAVLPAHRHRQRLIPPPVRGSSSHFISAQALSQPLPNQGRFAGLIGIGPGRIEPATLGLKVPRNHSFSLPLFRPFRRRLRLVLGVYASLFVTSYESARCVHGALSSTLLIVAVNRSPRRLVHDADLVRRRAAGESLRTVAADYGVAHTTLSRYFARKDVAAQLRAARRALQAEGRAARAGRAAGRQIERTVRRQAKEEAALARSFSEIDLQPPGPRRSDFEAWLDERDARRPWLRQDLRTRSDDLAARTAEGGGGIDALIEATGLRTLENLVRRIDPAILVRAYDNDADARTPTPPDRSRLRRLSPDVALMHRRIAGEPLRRLARDYDVSHTTLGRWFARPSVARQMDGLQSRRRPRVQPQAGGRPRATGDTLAGTRG
jgi:hypothetical protein